MSTRIKRIKMEFVPRCPHCERELHEIAERSSFWGNQNLLACPECHKVLGVSNVG